MSSTADRCFCTAVDVSLCASEMLAATHQGLTPLALLLLLLLLLDL
jgi:hypothetical protein